MFVMYKWMMIGMLLVFSGCKEDHTKQVINFGKAFNLMENESIQLTQSTNTLLSIQQIEDSRCPQGAECITAGYVRVSFILSDATDTTTLPTCLGTCESFQEGDTVLANFRDEAFELILQEVLPYPMLHEGRQEKQVTLIVNSVN